MGTDNPSIGLSSDPLAAELASASLSDREAAERIIEVMKAIVPHLYRVLRFADDETVQRLEALIEAAASAKRAASQVAASEYGIG